MTFIDITRPFHTGLQPWPGDQPPEFHLAARIRDGDLTNVGRLSLSTHNGTHADAPYHYNDAGLTIDALSPELFIGPARVIDARGHATFTEALFDGIDLAASPRVLFRTDTWTDPTVFPQTWPLLAPHLPAWLAARGVKLIGLDVPSVDKLGSPDIPMHHACDATGLIILENLDLRPAPAGIYELIALPLRIRGGDGSPVRAVLRTLG